MSGIIFTRNIKQEYEISKRFFYNNRRSQECLRRLALRIDKSLAVDKIMDEASNSCLFGKIIIITFVISVSEIDVSVTSFV